MKTSLFARLPSVKMAAIALKPGSRLQLPLLAYIVPRSMKLERFLPLAGLAAFALGLCSCEELPPNVQGPLGAVMPAPTPGGWWNDNGAGGSPKIVVRIAEQKAYFFKGRHLIGESTVSTGKPGFGTPPGHYSVVSKSIDHVSSAFGDYVDDAGNVVRFNIDSRKDRRPPGTHFDGARMPYAMFFRGGYAMHQGYVPPYAASHGCIRIPKGMADKFFNAAPVGTPVIVTEN
jgi:hypothetical protein